MSRLVIVLAALACGVVGCAVVVDPRAVVAVPALCATAAVCMLAYRRPRLMLTVCMFLVLVAGTKFGARDEMASLSATVDASVVLELGLYAVIALIALVAAVAPGFPAQRMGVMEWLLVAFVAFAIASTVWSEAPLLTLVRAGQLGVLVALGIVSIRVLDVPGTLHALGTTVVTYVLACAAIAVAFPGTRVTVAAAPSVSHIVVATSPDRFTWFGLHSISAAIFTAVAILYLLSVVLALPGGWQRRRFGIPVALGLVPLTAVLVATSSRGPLFALLGAGATLVVVLAVRATAGLTLAAVAASIAVVASLGGVTPTSLLDDAARSNSSIATVLLRGQNVQEFGTLTGRTQLWADLVPLYLDHPFVGYGYQASRGVLLRLRPWAGHAHNAILQTMLDVGAVGTLLIWVPFFWALCVGARARSSPKDPARWERASVFAMSVFMLINSISDVSPAGGPAYETLLFLYAIIATERLARGRTSMARAASRVPPQTWGARVTATAA